MVIHIDTRTTLTFSDRVVSGIFVFSLQFLLLVSPRRVPSAEFERAISAGGSLELLGVGPWASGPPRPLLPCLLAIWQYTLLQHKTTVCFALVVFVSPHTGCVVQVPSSLFSVFLFLRLKNWFEMDVRFCGILLILSILPTLFIRKDVGSQDFYRSTL